jgi:hypothetical protein
MLSRLIKDKIHAKFGHTVRYPKDCHALAEHMGTLCKAKISPSTLKRLYGFVKGASQEPRLYTLDLISDYLGYKGWEQLVNSIDDSGQAGSKEIEKLKQEQIKKGQSVLLTYEPGKKIELQKNGNNFLVLSSNDRKLLANDTVHFHVVQTDYPLSLTNVTRKGEGLGKMQLATVSGITSITKL